MNLTILLTRLNGFDQTTYLSESISLIRKIRQIRQICVQTTDTPSHQSRYGQEHIVYNLNNANEPDNPA